VDRVTEWSANECFGKVEIEVGSGSGWLKGGMLCI
jgi:hypothetical protein